jgi:transcriptional regulator with XRE-family HTH domain
LSSTNYSKNGDSGHFGEWLRRLRVERGLPLRAVAAAAEMDVALLSKIELGQRLPTEEQTSKLAQFFRLRETEVEARRMAEKFRLENRGSPKAAREAICLLAEEAGIYRAKRT